MGLPLAIAVIGLTLMGFNTVGIGFLPLSDIVFLVVATVLGLLLLTGKLSTLASSEARRSSPRLMVATLVLLAMATVSSMRSWHPEASIGVVLRLVYLTFLWFWILRCLSVSRQAIDWLLRAWRWGVLISCAGAVAADLGLITLGDFNAEGRQTGWFGHPNDLAGYLAVAVPLFVFAAPRSATWSKRRAELTWLVTSGFVVYALATTGSMSALAAVGIGILAGGAALLVTRRASGRRVVHPVKVMVTLIVAGVALTLLLGSDAPVIERITRYEEGDSSIQTSVGTRGTLNERVINRFDELLVAGHGLDLRAQDQLRGADAGIHNMYVKVLFEAGLIAALALLVFLIVSLQLCWKLLVNMRATDVHSDLAAIFGSCVVAITFALFQPIMFHRFFWLPFGVIQCYWTMRRNELRELAAHTPAPGLHPAPVGPR